MNKLKNIFSCFSIVARTELPKLKGILIRVISFLVTFIISMFICYLVVKENYFKIIGTLFQGAFARPWKLIMDACLLLGFGVAIIPSFKMKYWNMGANGQVLMGSLLSIIVMFYMNDFASKSSFNNGVLILIMFIVSIIGSVIWALIPALFKVFFNTNETLFTLMMNYIAGCLVSYVNFVLAQGKQESPGIINFDTQAGWFPVVIDKYFLPILIVVIMTVAIYFYMSKTKDGFEICVVGDSINTAKYVGMNTKKIILRTIILGGVLCGIIGFLYTSAINQSINKNTCGSLGFTGVLIAWLCNFNPLTMAGVSFLLAFLTNGTSKISSVYRLGSNNLANVIIGMLFFSILISEFIIRFKVKFNFKKERGEQ